MDLSVLPSLKNHQRLFDNLQKNAEGIGRNESIGCAIEKNMLVDGDIK